MALSALAHDLDCGAKALFSNKRFDLLYLFLVCNGVMIMPGEVDDLAQAACTTSWQGGRALLNRMRLTRSVWAQVQLRWLSRVRNAGIEGPPWGSIKDDNGL